MKVDIVYLAFAVGALLAFRAWRPAVAVLVVFLGGWLVLPVGHYPAGSAEAPFPYWITGLAVPSDMLLTKAWVAPAAALLGVVAFDRGTLRGFRPGPVDLPMALWCTWPLLRWPFLPATDPAAAIGCLYLAGTWGLPWLLGRLYFSGPAARCLLARGLALAGLACLPIALLEGLQGPIAYGAVYEPHPFRHDGIERYLGYRPLGFFEDGNQYGIWVSLCALAALWLAAAPGPGRRTRGAGAVAAAVALTALAAQSVGALAMLATGAAFLGICRWQHPRRLAVAAAAALTLVGALYVSGRVPITRLAKDTAIGRQVVDGLRSVGRGSFGWRIAQDQKLLPRATARPLVGNPGWDWWRAQSTRPWGLSVLVLGQFGLPGLCLCLGSLLWPAGRVAWQAPPGSGWTPAGLPLMLATVVGLAGVDALMNSFVFFPALLIGGGLAAGVAEPRRRGEITRLPRRVDARDERGADRGAPGGTAA